MSVRAAALRLPPAVPNVGTGNDRGARVYRLENQRGRIRGGEAAQVNGFAVNSRANLDFRATRGVVLRYHECGTDRQQRLSLGAGIVVAGGGVRLIDVNHRAHRAFVDLRARALRSRGRRETSGN